MKENHTIMYERETPLNIIIILNIIINERNSIIIYGREAVLKENKWRIKMTIYIKIFR